jgi:Rps23 Pro-64 3,4-dihydroxylase Tpa1-like proline 4-hydroxylase
MNELNSFQEVDDARTARWSRLAVHRDQYLTAQPFPFLVIDDFLTKQETQAAKDFPHSADNTWTSYTHVNEKKYGLSKRDRIPDSLLSIIDSLQSAEFMEALSSVTGIPGLMADDQLSGGGLHQMYPGGFLNIHSDFLIHPTRKNLKRRINLILFLSDDWKEEYGGNLEFWDREMSRCVTRLQPVFNRCVMFQTDEYSYHGCPDKLGGYPGFSRKTIALYYYTEYTRTPTKQSTDYKARPEDRNKLAIWLDNKAVAIYSMMKRRLGLNDDFASRLLKFIRRR